MSEAIKCFLLEPSELAQEYLRRFVSSDDPARACMLTHGYHDATTVLGHVPHVEHRVHGDFRDHGDLRWPQRCECGYRFQDCDPWQYGAHQLYRRSDNGELTTLQDAPAGAMWYADWFENLKGPDGRCLVVKTPGGEWLVDGKASNGPGWSRAGVPPNVTASPSIGFTKPDGSWRYHGWLRNGVLEPC